ncbi:hypothetical protein BANRA_04987 [Escherichia coli]|nr:hypothetical protein BANRA_04987 [Escherichia coli]
MNLQLNINEHGVSHRLIKKTSNKLLVFFSGTDKKDGRFDFWKSADELPYNILLINNGKMNGTKIVFQGLVLQYQKQ